MLDLAWLEAMHGGATTLPVAELIRLACKYPLDNGAILESPEMREALLEMGVLHFIRFAGQMRCANIPLPCIIDWEEEI